MSRFYITTAIPYVNAKPHIGFALELVQADVITRYQRQLLGNDNVRFVTGTDENALKNVQAAEKQGQSTADYVVDMSKRFQDLASALKISNDDFIRTTEKRHIEGATKLWNACKAEDIYKKSYTGKYCVGCEQYYKDDELENGLCPEHKTQPEAVSEENYFFKLSNYQSKLEKLISSDEFKITPQSRKNEMLAFIKRGLDDFSISRSHERARGWGVPVPNNNSQVMYVWFDALSNYLNALGYAYNDKLYKEFWAGKGYKLHCIGKGITRFHCLYWPAMLLSAGLPLPNEVFVHGYVTVDGQKISKSLGNTIDPVSLIEKYGYEPVRYYLLREIPAWDDGDFSEEKFKQRYTSDLANGLGNTVSRVTNMVEKFCQGQVVEGMTEFDIVAEMEVYGFDKALEKINANLRQIDQEIDETKPWDMAKRGESVIELVTKWVHSLRGLAEVLAPFLPESSRKIKEALGNKINKIEPLFPRLNN